MLRDETVMIRICAHQNTVSLYLTYETVQKWGMLDYDKKKFFMEVEIHLSNAAYIMSNFLQHPLKNSLGKM